MNTGTGQQPQAHELINAFPPCPQPFAASGPGNAPKAPKALARARAMVEAGQSVDVYTACLLIDYIDELERFNA